MGALLFGVIVAISVLGAPERALAQRDDADRGSASVRVASVGGARSEGEAERILARATELLDRCAEQGHAARASGDVRVRLEVAASGRASPLAIVDRGERATREQVAFRECAVRALARLRLDAGEAGTIDLLVRWDVAHAPPVVGGLGDRRSGSGLPGHMRRDPATRARPTEYPPEEVSRVAREHQTEVRACFDDGLVSRPGLHGTVTVRFTIGTDGAVTDAEVESEDVRMPSLAACVVMRVRTWTFPAPPAGEPAQVSHPFVFRSH